MKNTGTKSKALFSRTTKKCPFCGKVFQLWPGKIGWVFPFHHIDFIKREQVCKGSLKK